MFTGLIEEVGTLKTLSRTRGSLRISVSAPSLAKRLKTGDSIAVSGVCLTALNIAKKSFEADLAAETVAKTSLSRLKPGTQLNLELPMKAGSPLGGHIVQGHVDGVSILVSLTQSTGGADWRLIVEVPDDLAKYVVAKGSITIEGISLTVAKIEARRVEIAIIPHTYRMTNLKSLQPGAPLNVEVDILAKYAEKWPAQTSPVTVERLLREGF